MAVGNDYEFVRLRLGDSMAIDEATKTLCRAFANDPFIQWLRPAAPALDDFEADLESFKFQKRRIERAILLGSVYVLSSAKRSKPTGESTSVLSVTAVAFLSPPSSGLFALLRSLPARLHLWLLDRFSPVSDTHAPAERIMKMMESHDTNHYEVEKALGRSPGYIEVVAVDPAYQGQRLGQRLLDSLLCKLSYPVWLECTRSGTSHFYEKRGFRVLKTATLSLEDNGEVTDSCEQWLMIKN